VSGYAATLIIIGWAMSLLTPTHTHQLVCTVKPSAAGAIDCFFYHRYIKWWRHHYLKKRCQQ